ncbi:hypothetical protein ACVI53_001735 [Bradyrhizobium barranii subsp. barranii]
MMIIAMWRRRCSRASRLEDLRLDRDVERRGRLVRNQQFRLAGQRDRNRDALAHAAGTLMRILREPLLRRRDADGGEQLDAALPRRRRVELEMLLDRLHQLGADGQHRVERGHGVLEHDREVAPAQAPQTLGVKPHQILAVEHHASGQLRLLRQELKHRAR